MKLGYRGMMGRVFAPAIVFAASLSYFAHHLREEGEFQDEAAYIAQTYYYRLLLQGRIHDIDWLHQASYDHLQVGRLLAGMTLDLHGYDAPTSIEAMERWWSGETETVEPGRLRAARWSMLFGAAFGCAMIYLLGRMLVGPLTGFLAAVLLAASPVYFTHARRVMADDWVQAFLLAALAASVGLARRTSDRPLPRARFAATAVGAGILFGLAVATKLNGAVGLIALLTAMALTLVAASTLRGSTKPAGSTLTLWIGGVAVTVFSATATFVGIHPYFYARPVLPEASRSDSKQVIIDGQPRSREWIDKEIRPLAHKSPLERFRHMIQYRQEQLDKSHQTFPQFALSTAGQRIWAILNQGIGRWSAASRTQLPPSFAWIPAAILVAFGLVWCVGEGRRQWFSKKIPIAWAIALWPIVETIVLLRELTLDWDRYYLGVVTWTSLLSAVGAFGTLQQVAHRMVLAPPQKSQPIPGIAHGQ